MLKYMYKELINITRINSEYFLIFYLHFITEFVSIWSNICSERCLDFNTITFIMQFYFFHSKLKTNYVLNVNS